MALASHHPRVNRIGNIIKESAFGLTYWMGAASFLATDTINSFTSMSNLGRATSRISMSSAALSRSDKLLED